ncbi:MAG: phosphoglycolate phosphatase [Gammaproteobacteria bacterium]|nr:phosphoglycolate phosphatase [Gammaproteobacteria bacterium]
MKPYPGYLFDLDGTLVDTALDINAALNFALSRHGYREVSEALTRHWIGHGAKVLVEQAFGYQQKPQDEAEPVLREFLDYYAAHAADLSQPYPAVVDALGSLRDRGAALAVVTNKVTTFSITILEALDLARHFDTVVCGDTTATPKPAADPALHACGALGLAPQDALFVGDSQTDVLCARAAGCPVVCVRNGYNHGVPAEQLGADAVIESFSDLV